MSGAVGGGDGGGGGGVVVGDCESGPESVISCSESAGTSLESTTSAEDSETGAVTQIDLRAPSTTNTQRVPIHSSSTTTTTTTTRISEDAKLLISVESQFSKSVECPSTSLQSQQLQQQQSQYQHSRASDPQGEFEGETSETYEEDDNDDDDTLSSEAVVDDIELILMPEEAQDLSDQQSPKLVRVTELTLSTEDVFCDEDDEDENQEGASEFRKMDSEIAEESASEADEETEGAVGYSHSIDEDPEPSSGRELIRIRGSRRNKVHSGVQTDITALENSSSSPYDFRRKTSAKTCTTPRLGIPGKKLNWKSELTLLPSKTKIGQSGFSAYGSTDDRDQYSPRVAKFTSQDTLNSSSQFLRPSTLYRTRNLSRNLNRFASSESTLAFPMTDLPTDSPRYRDRISSSTSAANFKGSSGLHSHSHSSYQISSSSNLRRQPSYSVSSARNFRSSLPDLSCLNMSSHDNKRRQNQKSMKHHQSSSGFRLHKKLSSSDDETSSLIDESERCLRSSIDLLLTDDYPSPASEYHYRPSGLGHSYGSASGYYSAKRSSSQPILTDQGYCADPRDPTMGSPFLPRKLCDMRCSRWAKVILPNGHVAVVAVKEMDEFRDILTVHTDTGCILSLPFRKVVFAWKTKR